MHVAFFFLTIISYLYFLSTAAFTAVTVTPTKAVTVSTATAVTVSTTTALNCVNSYIYQLYKTVMTVAATTAIENNF